MKHGLSRTPIYQRWRGMIDRCTLRTIPAWKWYGAKGIGVCERWLKFENFLADMGMPPFPKATIERIDPFGPYSPSNCKWATYREQAYNKSISRQLTLNGRTQSAWKWSQELGISTHRIARRKQRGWSDERALTTPLKRDTMLTFKGEVLPLRQWAKLFGLKSGTLWARLKKGWPLGYALAIQPKGKS